MSQSQGSAKKCSMVDESCMAQVPPSDEEKQSKFNYAMGVFALLLVVVGWVGTNFLTGVLYYDDTTFLTCSFIGYLG